MEFDELTALKQLVFCNRHSFVDGDKPLRILCFDEDGKIVPWDMVFAASPKDSFPSVSPSPGTGYYAHLRRRCGAIEASDSDVSEWEVKGPDWEGIVRVARQPASSNATANLLCLSAGGKKFLSQFGQAS